MAPLEYLTVPRGVAPREGWDGVHDGYFSDPDIARPLVSQVLASMQQSHPDAVVDIGGGTGFLVGLLAESCAGENVSFVCIDGSPAQIEAANARGVTSVLASAHSFSMSISDSR